MEKLENNISPEKDKTEINQEALDLCKGNYELAQKVMEARKKYGDNAWWESDDPMEVAWGQLNEPVFVMNVDRFRIAVGEALGRRVDGDELYLESGRKRLMKELEAKRKTKK